MKICEQCDHGYPATLSACHWCGTPDTFAHERHGSAAVDTECYRDYWLCKFSTGEVFQLAPDIEMNLLELRAALSRYRVITFNGQNYDMPIISLALAGYDNAALKQASDLIIQRGLKPWDIEREYNVQRLTWIDHVDLFDVAPGQGSLKAYGGKMHMPTIQDLPIDPSASIRWCDRVLLRDYCDNDLDTTLALADAMKAQLALRDQMSAEYGIDLRSKSDAQIAEAIMKSLLAFKVERPPVQPGAQFHFRPAPWLRFVNLDLLALLARNPFTISDKGSPTMSDELAATVIRIGGSAYKMGAGGLHSMEESVSHHATDDVEISDHDVASYYPSLILTTGIYPRQIGEVFQTIYRGWFDRRMAAKRAGNKKVANSLKTLLNGTFGKLGSAYSIFYAPSELIQVTLTGQLALLMMIERLELGGVPVISANTDGIVVKCPKSLAWYRDATLKWWEETTGFETERSDYRAVYSRDVNSYVILKTDGDVKLKGAFAPPDPGPSGWPNPGGQICVDAVVAYLRDGVPVETTIRACTDVRQFVFVKKVEGGGSFVADGTLEKKTTQRNMRAMFGEGIPVAEMIARYDALRAARLAGAEYLGKIVRWYYAAGSRGEIVYARSGNLVGTTTGCRPMMTLTDSVPTDLDYDWYINEARAMLKVIDAPVNEV